MVLLWSASIDITPAFSTGTPEKAHKTHPVVESSETRMDGNWIILKKKAVVDAPMDTLAHFLKNVPTTIAIVPALKQKTILKQFSETERIDYDHFEMPRPFKDRYVIYQAKQETHTGREILFTLNSPENYPFEDKDKVLGVVKESSLLLQPHNKDKSKTHLTVIMQVDPGGLIPVWLINFHIDKLWERLFHRFQKNIQKEISKQNAT
ncbi:MAG: hypothetical protein NPINA01_07900 [Nitrospinaceae bacterium]|nr:MAG: hypothetical protein NPINA01_07900 [Nitrospinaceae bacterium]